MKAIILFIGSLILSSTGVFAADKVGDFVIFEGSFEGSGGGTMNFEQKLIVKEIKNDGNFNVQVIIDFDGQKHEQNLEIDKNEILSSLKVTEILTKCESEGGVKKMYLVGDKEFQTCYAEEVDGSKIWIGAVPFGVVRQVALDESENIITLTVKSFGNEN